MPVFYKHCHLIIVVGYPIGMKRIKRCTVFSRDHTTSGVDKSSLV